MPYVSNHTTDNQNYQPLLFPLQEDPPPYPLQTVTISANQRLKPDWICQLVHYESGLKLGGQFTYPEAKKILETTKYWDFTINKDRMPKCADKLLPLLERICNCEASRRHHSCNSQPSKDREVAA